MSEAAIQLERLPGETLAIHLSGKWQLGKDVPSADKKLAELPDGIHSGLVRPGNRGIFFYFQGRTEGGKKLDFWKYYDLKTNQIIDNRFIIANLIACEKDTPRVVEPDMFAHVFDIQEKVMTDILQSFGQKEALEKVPELSIRSSKQLPQQSKPTSTILK